MGRFGGGMDYGIGMNSKGQMGVGINYGGFQVQTHVPLTPGAYEPAQARSCSEQDDVTRRRRNDAEEDDMGRKRRAKAEDHLGKSEAAAQAKQADDPAVVAERARAALARAKEAAAEKAWEAADLKRAKEALA